MGRPYRRRRSTPVYGLLYINGHYHFCYSFPKPARGQNLQDLLSLSSCSRRHNSHSSPESHLSVWAAARRPTLDSWIFALDYSLCYGSRCSQLICPSKDFRGRGSLLRTGPRCSPYNSYPLAASAILAMLGRYWWTRHHRLTKTFPCHVKWSMPCAPSCPG